jgi:hypothetical protein
VDGREVLAEIKADRTCAPSGRHPASRAEEDIVRSYDLHANAYVTAGRLRPVHLSRPKIDEFSECGEAATRG